MTADPTRQASGTGLALPHAADGQSDGYWRSRAEIAEIALADVKSERDHALAALRERLTLSVKDASEQRDTMTFYSEFWRGRWGAFVDVLAWIDEAWSK